MLSLYLILKVFNVNPRAIGVRLFKVVGNHYQEKRIHVRVEHLQKSRTREAFKERIKENDKLKAAANKEVIKKYIYI
jgi:large subunit ribosomal protein L21e